VRVELLAALEEVREEAVLERVALALRDEVEDVRLKDVGAGVDGVDANLLGLRLLPKGADASVPLGLDEAVGARVLDGREHDGRRRAALLVLTDDGLEVEVGQDVAVEDDRRLAQEVLGELVGAGRPHRLRLDGVVDLDAEVRPVAELLLDLQGLIGERERDVVNPCAAERVDLVEQERAVTDGDDGLRRVERQRPEPRALSPCENESLHDVSNGAEV
jgi:hypothetical protein